MKSFIRGIAVVSAVLILSRGAFASTGGGEGAGGDLTHKMMLLAFQLSVILVAAKLMGELFERGLKLPAVLGELAAGLIIGPYALGGIHLPVIDSALFPLADAAEKIVQNGEIVPIIPLSEVIYGIATFASIVLLFLAGLETDFRQFLRYAGPGGLVGLGGVAGAFVTGDLLTVFFGDTLGHPEWHFMSVVPLFMGTISVATSVGITARVLSEKGKLDTPEGVTILAGAVIDDVLGIIVLAIVGGIAAVETAGGGTAGVDWGHIGGIAGKAIGIWLVATVVLILLAKPLKGVLGKLRGEGVVPGVALGLALLLSGIMESAHLAMIIGAYVSGLALAKEEDLAHRLDGELRPLYNIIVPVFFCAMGMLVNFEAMSHALVFGIIFSLVAVFAKVIGCGLPTYLVKFNTRGALRVGIGMLPRGEVALIVAGYGLAAGYIGNSMFGVSIMMTLITTVIAPPVLVALFRGGSGLRGGPAAPVPPAREIVWASGDLATPKRETVLRGVVGALRDREDYEVSVPAHGEEIYLVAARDEDFDFLISGEERRIEVHASPADRDRALGVFTSALAAARGVFEDLEETAE